MKHINKQKNRRIKILKGEKITAPLKKHIGVEFKENVCWLKSIDRIILLFGTNKSSEHV